MKKQPWAKFYFSDWRADPRLRMCGLAARGLWMEMLALMHEATPYGHLLISGISPTDAQLAVLAGAPSDQIPELLGELESAGVFSRTRSGAIYSRRMTRDFKKAENNRKNGKLGGNPSLCKDEEKPPPVNPPDKGGDKAQKPDARSQIPEREGIDGSELEAARERASRRRPEVPLPQNWTPSDRNLSDAQARHFSDQEIRHEADRFRDYHLARDSRFRDWDAAWRTWLSNVGKFQGRRVAGASYPGGGGSGGSLASIAARRRAEGAV